MLTQRGFWFFIVVLASLSLAVGYGATQLTLVGATLLLWFLAQWFLFQLRVRLALRRLTLERILRTARGEVETVWAGQEVEVAVKLSSHGLLGLPYVVVSERLPALAQFHEGTLRQDGTLSVEQPLALTYTIEGKAAGRLRFEGVKVELADLQGFFVAATFVRAPHEYRVLPPLVVEASQTPFVKQHNILPLLGTHRHARPGGSSELLDLRDYLTGDPPKLIAWKVSARRDRLITRVFESEVPIRCTLFVDTSNSVRVGPVGATALCRLVELAAGVAQANASERDLTGLCLFGEAGVEALMRPGRGSGHLLKMLDLLTGVANRLPHAPRAYVQALMPYAYGLAQDVYPEWLEDDVNSFPTWLPYWAPRLRWMTSPWHYPSAYRWRKQMSAILSVRYRLGPGGLALLLEDDRMCADYLQRFLAEHQIAVPLPLFDEAGRYVFAAPEKVKVLAAALLKSILHGKDNELFVLCVDLLELADDLGPLERAVCVAKARHHQVIVVCPWPQGVAPPSRRGTSSPSTPFRVDDLHVLLQQLATKELHDAFAKVQRVFGRLGVSVICAAEGDSVDLILQRMRRLRVQERGVR